MTWLEKHSESEDLAVRAEAAIRSGEYQNALALYHEAAAHEAEALQLVPPDNIKALGITAISAVALYFKAKEFQRAKDIAEASLNMQDMPQFAKEELSSILNAIFKEITTNDYEVANEENTQLLEADTLMMNSVTTKWSKIKAAISKIRNDFQRFKKFAFIFAIISFMINVVQLDQNFKSDSKIAQINSTSKAMLNTFNSELKKKNLENIKSLERLDDVRRRLAQLVDSLTSWSKIKDQSSLSRKIDNIVRQAKISRSLTGLVSSSSSEGIPDVLIRAHKGGQTYSNSNGEYIIICEAYDTIFFSKPGYKSVQRMVQNRYFDSHLNVSLDKI